MLAANAGWSLSDSPDPHAELNHFICYIDYAETFDGWCKTPISAYLTHHESKRPDKAQWWDIASRGCDLRIITARRYAPMLEEHGPTALVRPPVDQELFRPEPRPPHNKPVVGLSGFVDRRSNRKGIELVAQLMRDRFSREISLKAMGFGWPVQDCRETANPDAELPAFYRGLDVFLCTSLIEANPMPPLEALACGIPVVIPRDVGMMDDLPDTEGIYRYDKGDFDSMLEALELARDSQVAQEPLRAAVGQYTPENWAEDHEKAFERLLYDVPTVPNAGQRGMYCVGFRGPARNCAGKLIGTFKKHMDIPVAFVGTEALGVEDHFIECPDVDIGGRHAKLKIDELAPPEWSRILYLDADTEVIAPIDFLWKPLEDGWDFVICKNPGKYHLARNMVRPDNRDECEKTYNLLGSDEIMQLNGGVFAYQRNERTRAFFAAWYEEWNKYGKRDQAAMLRALWRAPLKMLVLTNAWNTVPDYDAAQTSAGIMHYPMRARSWRGVIHGRSDSDEAWRRVKEFGEGR